MKQLQEAVLALRRMGEKLDAIEQARREPIAVVGIGCRFPGGGHGPERFWRLLREGTDGVSEVPAERWDVDSCYDQEPGRPGKTCCRWGGFIPEVDRFDAAFFGISAREAVSMDPQQRLVLETAWEALEDAALAPGSLAGSATGVYLGISTSDYLQLGLWSGDPALIDPYSVTGGASSVTAGRLSYLLGLRGPSLAVNTACSSSLVAVHLACQSLRAGECELALAGGVNLMLSPIPSIALSAMHMMARDGRCKAFDAAADGFVRGEGCGIVVLRRLADARAAGDRILGLVLGSAVNQDGQSGSLTAPNGPAQEAVIRGALTAAGVAPGEVGYVEAHGTGTALGDPIEAQALATALTRGRPPELPLLVGSVKTNIGHLEAAAGVAGLIKTVLALVHREIPPHLHLRQISPHIDLEGVALRIPTALTPWPAPAAGRRIAGVNAFGFSGTNAHVVLAEAPAEENGGDAIPERPRHLLCLSARTPSALAETARRHAAVLGGADAPALADAAFTANAGRAHHACRLAVLATSSAEAAAALAAFAAGREDGGLLRARLPEAPAAGGARDPEGSATAEAVRTAGRQTALTATGEAKAQAARISASAPGGAAPRIAFLFSGQGAQYPGMGRLLHSSQPVFRRVLDRCDDALRPLLGGSLLERMFEGSAADLERTALTQPALFALEVALAALWRSWGIEPAALLGHSVGEYAAACVAGLFSLEDGLRLVARRARLMEDLPAGGAMASVFASEERIAAALRGRTERLAVAAINGPDDLVISGDAADLDAVLAELAAEGVRGRRLATSHAFHSPRMEPVLGPLEEAAGEVAFATPRLALVTNLTGRPAARGEMTAAAYWREQARRPVRFAQGIESLRQEGCTVFLEIGPGTALSAIGRRAGAPVDEAWLPSLRSGRDDWETVLGALREIHLRGAAVDWAAFDRGHRRRRVALPTYPFERRRHWLSATASGGAPGIGGTAASPAAAGSAPPPLLGDGLYEIGWEPLPGLLAPPERDGEPAEAAGSWLILGSGALAAALAERLAALGGSCQLADTADDILAAAPDATWRGVVDLRPSAATVSSGGADGPRAAAEETSTGALGHLSFAIGAAGGAIGPANGGGGQSGGAIGPAGGIDAAGSLGLGPLSAAATPAAPAGPAAATETVNPTAPTAAALEICAAALELVQALASRPRPSRLWLVTRSAQALDASEEPWLATAPLRGLGRVAAREHREVWGGLIDLPATPGPEDAAALACILARVPEEEDELALRGGEVYAARLRRRQPPGGGAAPVPAVRPDAAYWIVGGLGALGLRVARWLAERGARHLVLTGRHAPSPAAEEALAALRAAGVAVRVVLADMANAAAAAGALAEIDAIDQIDKVEAVNEIEGTGQDAAAAPPLAGVIHAAGVLADAVLLRQDRAHLARAFAAKVDAAWNLHLLTRERQLDFFVLFSSSAALLGTAGQAAYAAANSFLDGLAAWRRAQGLPGLSVAWGAWSGGGMAAARPTPGAAGMRPLAPGDAVAALGALLAAGSERLPAHVAVMAMDWVQLLAAAAGARVPALLSGLMEPLAGTAAAGELRRRLAAAPRARRPAVLRAHLRAELRSVLGLMPEQPMADGEGFFVLGMDSLMALELRNRLQAAVGSETPLASTLAFDHPTLDGLARHLASLLDAGAAPAAPGGGREGWDGGDASGAAAAAAVTGAGEAGEPIAIVGIGCRFAGGAHDPESFWRLLRDGIDAVGEVPRERWDAAALYDPDPEAPGRSVSRWGSFVAGVDRFDAAFFGISPREAVAMDPQHRLLLEVSWQALEDANILPGSLSGSDTGVFVGISATEYAALLTGGGDARRIDAYAGVGNALSAAAGRLSYTLGLAGPSVALDTACSSSLVAIDQACLNLRAGRCRLALAGGVNLMLSPATQINLSQSRMLAPDGRCKTFDAAADGYVRGEGCGMLVLKPLAAALADGDLVHAVLLGSAVNQDGRSAGLTVPNGPAQEAVIGAALSAAGVAPASVGYVEAHGTGTALGDPIEIHALARVYGRDRPADRPLLVGSVKTNLGHLEPAAGVAGLIKAVLALEHGEIPPHLHFRQPNPHIAWEEIPVRVAARRCPWPDGGGPRIAAVSSFGFVGTNAHVILRDAPPRAGRTATGAADRASHLLLLSARDEAALGALAESYRERLAAEAAGDPALLADVCHTASARRARLSHRLAVVGGSTAEVCAALAAARDGHAAPGLLRGVAAEPGSETAERADGAVEPEAKEAAPADATVESAARRLAEIFVQGGAPDLVALDGGGAGHRLVRLPTYPFRGERHWPAPLPAVAAAQVPRALRLQSASREAVFTLPLDGDAPGVLGDHRIGGTVVVPAACLLTLVLGAAEELLLGHGMLCIEGATFQQPLALPPGEKRSLQIVLDHQPGNGAAFRAVSALLDASGLVTWTLHASGSVSLDVTREAAPSSRPPAAGAVETIPPVAPMGLAIGTAASGGNGAAEAANLYEMLERSGVGLGPGFRWLQEVRRSAGEAAGGMRAAGGGEHDPEDLLHPGLLDSCFQLLGAALPDEGGEPDLFLPLGIDRLVLWRRPGAGPSLCRARCREAAAPRPETFTGDLDLAEPAAGGAETPLLRISGLHLKRAGSELAGRRLLADSVYTTVWQVVDPITKPSEVEAVGAALDAGRATATGPLAADEPATALDAGRTTATGPQASWNGTPHAWLLLADRGGVGAALDERLRASGDRCRLVTPDEWDAWTSHVESEATTAALLAALGDLHHDSGTALGVLFLRSLDAPGGFDLAAAEIARHQEIALGGALRLAHGLLAAPASGHRQRLWLVTRGAQEVPVPVLAERPPDLPPPVAVAQAPLWGFAASLALEHPELGCVRVDLDPAGPPAAAAADLERELRAAAGEDRVAWRHGVRLAERLVRATPGTNLAADTGGESAAPRAGKVFGGGESGTYLITGGLGGLGLAVARWLAGRGIRHLVLAGRRPPEAAGGALAALRGAGAEPAYVQADLAVPEDAARLIAACEHGRPPLRGVIHAAGVIEDRVIQGLTWEQCATVLAPKVQGTWNLHRLTRDRQLDDFVLFSSAAAVLGAAGQASYAAANAFLDALASHRRAQGLPALSLGWGAWSEIGTAARRGLEARIARRNLGLLAPAAALEALGRLMEIARRERTARMARPGQSPAPTLARAPALAPASAKALASASAQAPAPAPASQRDGATAAGAPLPARLAILPVDWQRFGTGDEAPLWRDLARTARQPTWPGEPAPDAGLAGLATSPQGPAALRRRLAETPPAERRTTLAEHIERQAARVLGLGPSAPLPARRPLGEVGMDSLMALELRNALGVATGLTLPATLLFDHPSVAELTAHLADRLDLPAAGRAAVPASAADASAPAAEAAATALAEAVIGLSEEALDSVVAEELGRLLEGR